jgi:hypothetical protein
LPVAFFGTGFRHAELGSTVISLRRPVHCLQFSECSSRGDIGWSGRNGSFFCVEWQRSMNSLNPFRMTGLTDVVIQNRTARLPRSLNLGSIHLHAPRRSWTIRRLCLRWHAKKRLIDGDTNSKCVLRPGDGTNYRRIRSTAPRTVNRHSTKRLGLEEGANNLLFSRLARFPPSHSNN